MDIGYWILDIFLFRDDANTQYPIPNIDYLAAKDPAGFVKFFVVENEPCPHFFLPQAGCVIRRRSNGGLRIRLRAICL